MFQVPAYLSQSPFEWVSAHLQLVGWPVLIFVCWKLRGMIDKYLKDVAKSNEMRAELLVALNSLIAGNKEANKQAAETHDAVKLMKAAVDDLREHVLPRIEDTLKDANQAHSTQIELLHSIDKGVAILVDRKKP